MVAWNTLRRNYGKSIFVEYAFSRISQGGHTNQSQHYAGVAFDVGQNLDNAGRAALRAVAVNSGVWSYVEPGSLTPHWVHVDKRLSPPACPVGGYPAVGMGSKGVYVFVLQDALMSIGYTGTGLDGAFGPGTGRAVVRFQGSQGFQQLGW